MSVSLSVLPYSSWRPASRGANVLPRRLSSLPSLQSLRPSRPKPFSSFRLQVLSSGNAIRFTARAAGDERIGLNEGSAGDEDVEAARGQSTLPERFRHLTKEAPDRPVRWPWLVALVFMVYAWRAVLWELSNWKNAAFAIVRSVGYVLKLILALVAPFIGPPVTALIWCIEFVLNFLRSLYFGVVGSTPVPELLWIIILTTTVLSIAEATVSDSVSSQPYLLTAAGLLAYGAVWGPIPELLFWLAMVGIFCYSWFIKKRDAISAALPAAAMLVAIGEPWVRVLTMAGYLGLAIFQNSQHPEADVKTGRILAGTTRLRAPVPLQLAALSIGIHLAAKWVRYRHLTWMIV